MPSKHPNREVQVQRWIDESGFPGRAGAEHTDLSITTHRWVKVTETDEIA